jgi:predicted Zn-dependent protease
MTMMFGLPAVAGEPPVLSALKDEISRSYAAYHASPDNPAYYISGFIAEENSFSARASFGGIEEVNRSTERNLDIDVRVGTPELDNTHRGEGDDNGFGRVPLGDDAQAVRTGIWLGVERKYRDAVDRYIKVVANRAVKVKEEDTSADFCPAPVETFSEPAGRMEYDAKAWTERTRMVSELFRKYGGVLECSATFVALGRAKYFASSEGASVAQYLPLMEFRTWAQARGNDGMEFALYRQYPARAEAGMPAQQKLLADADEMGRTLDALMKAPLVDPFTGPAMLSGRAAAVLFHEVVGHRLEGHRQKDENADQTFTRKVGKRILPSFLSLHADPTREEAGGVALMGHYKYDDEGVKARRVTLVEKGILRSFMLSRSPIKGFPSSNGHGRKSEGKWAVSRQSNLILEASRTVPVRELRKKLIAMCREKKKPYGLLFDDIEGGFTLTGRVLPNAFNVMPVLVWRVYADGRPDELVRGVDLIGTPLSTLDRIVAAGDDAGVFNGYCGAESGWVPVSAVAPSLLISEVEVQRKQKGQERLPLLPAPGWGGNK